MNNVATSRINTFGPSPEDQEQILEITVSELDRVLKEAGDFLNQAVALVEEAGILRGRELGRRRLLLLFSYPTTHYR